MEHSASILIIIRNVMQKDTVLEAGDPQMLFENVLKSIRDAGYQLEDVAYDYFALTMRPWRKNSCSLIKRVKP